MQAEAQAIRWAVDNGARVVNMSLGGLRDPRDPSRDTFSAVEAEAIAYAIEARRGRRRRGRELRPGAAAAVAFASYPAALPHVLGVSALARSGSSPSFSNRDAVYNDVAAPGEDIVSTFPRSLTAERPGVRRAGLHAVRLGRLPPGRGDVVRRAAGERGSREPARRCGRCCGPSR